VSEAEIDKRRAGWKVPAPRYPTGVLAKYARLAQGAERGAVTDV
jgi:dihydroxy-acid dehydratase